MANKNRAALRSGPGSSNHKTNNQMSDLEKIHPHRNNKNAESVNDALKPDDFLEAKRLEGDVEFMLRLVDLIFGFEQDRFPPS